MKSGVDEIELQGIEFWSNVCKVETRLASETSEVCLLFTMLDFYSKNGNF